MVSRWSEKSVHCLRKNAGSRLHVGSCHTSICPGVYRNLNKSKSGWPILIPTFLLIESYEKYPFSLCALNLLELPILKWDLEFSTHFNCRIIMKKVISPYNETILSVF